jgi:hypothetical protein
LTRPLRPTKCKPIPALCKNKNCHAKLLAVEIDDGRHGLACEVCGAVYVYCKHMYMNHYHLMRLIPTFED